MYTFLLTDALYSVSGIKRLALFGRTCTYFTIYKVYTSVKKQLNGGTGVMKHRFEHLGRKNEITSDWKIISTHCKGVFCITFQEE